MSRYVRGNVDEQQLLGTLGAKVVISGNFSETVVQTTLATSLVANWSMQDYTFAQGDGPIMVGVAHSDYTSAEIEAFIENNASWDIGDMIGQEVGKRLIRIVGTFSGFDANVGAASALNDGKPIKTKLNWKLAIGDTLKVWAYNLGTSALATTDPFVSVEGHLNMFGL